MSQIIVVSSFFLFIPEIFQHNTGRQSSGPSWGYHSGSGKRNVICKMMQVREFHPCTFHLQQFLAKHPPLKNSLRAGSSTQKIFRNVNSFLIVVVGSWQLCMWYLLYRLPGTSQRHGDECFLIFPVLQSISLPVKIRKIPGNSI